MMPKGGTFGGKHTYNDFGLIPKSKITFAPPDVKTTYIDVPAANGVLDYTGLMTGMIPYSNRQGTLEFIVLTAETYPTVYSQLLMHFHGQKMNIVLDDDPLFFYTGRLFVNKWKSVEGASTIAIDYDLEPYKKSFTSTGNLDWLWNDLFDNIIYYGSFNVKGSKQRNLINPSGATVFPDFTCANAITVNFNGATYSLPRGHSFNSGIELQPGNNVMTFNGYGSVLVDYALDLQL